MGRVHEVLVCCQRRRRSVLCRSLFWAVAIACGPWFTIEACADYYRVIYDYHTNRNDGIAYSNLFTVVPRPYTFGRIEGAPARGPNPVPGPGFGSTDVDTLYNIVPVIHQYYLDKFGRNGPNGLGGAGDGIHQPFNYYGMRANSPYTGPFNAWLGTNFDTEFGVGAVVPDVVGHELFHVVERFEIGGPSWALSGTDPASYYHNPSLAQFGSIVEGLSDFFGEAFERYATGSNDWIFGSGPGFPPFRSLSDPLSIAERTSGLTSADHLFSPNFRVPLNGDNFTYLNAGVINKASYLAVEGGDFNGLHIEGLGFDKVEQIWYRAVTEYFTPTETFAMAYDHFLLSANDLYGPADAAKLQQALRAVELNGVAVPEPSSLALCVMGMVCFGGAYYWRRQSPEA